MAVGHISCALLFLAALWSVCQGQVCNTLFEFNGSVVNFTKCASLGKQSALLAWTYVEDNNTLQVGFSGHATSTSGWVGWGINPTKPASMVGSSALVAFSASNGTNVLPYQLTEEVQNLEVGLACSPIDLIIESTAVEIQTTSMSIFASIVLPSNSTKLNLVWNRGPSVVKFQPQEHGQTAEDLSCFQTIDVYTAQISGGGAPPYQSLKRAHGIINTIAWGILLPIGVIVARYLHQFTESLWFYIHVPVQTLGYLFGVLGWALGLRLRAVTHLIDKPHQSIGYTLFVLATVQVFALVLRPNKNHKLRRYWNYYHYTLGYAIILLGIINIFKGLSILKPGGHWKSGYIASLVIMAIVAFVLEVWTWARYLKRRREEGMSGP